MCGGGAVEGSGVNEFSENSCFCAARKGSNVFKLLKKLNAGGHITSPRHVATSMSSTVTEFFF